MTDDYISVIPRVNLTTNIGVHGLHTRGQTEDHFRPYDQDFKVLNHPASIIRNVEYDYNHFKTYIEKKNRLLSRILKRIN